MGPETRITPNGDLEANGVADIDARANAVQPSVITQTSDARAGLAEGAGVAWTQELPALLQLLAMARQDLAAGRVKPLEGLRHRIRGSATR